jgi:thiamine pyrophosphokinase
MKILLIANGENVDVNYGEFDKVICVDGGLNALSNGVIPDAIVGDFDSAVQKKIEFFKEKSNGKSQIIFKDNQDVSDLLFALEFSLKEYKPNNITIINAISTDRIDHTLCNILLLKKIPIYIDAKIITKTQTIILVRKEIIINDRLGKTLSIIPITNCKNVNTNGLKWNISNVNIPFGFINGISNIITSNNSKIMIEQGEILVVVER